MPQAPRPRRNVQDATLKNVRVTRTQIAALAARVKALELRVKRLEARP